MSTVLPSPVHHPTIPGGALVHCGWETVNIVPPDTDSAVAVMLVLPAASALASPELPMVAIDVAEENQLTELVASFVLPLLKVSTAVNCWYAPTGTEEFAGMTVIDVKVGGVALIVVAPVTDP